MHLRGSRQTGPRCGVQMVRRALSQATLWTVITSCHLHCERVFAFICCLRFLCKGKLTEEQTNGAMQSVVHCVKIRYLKSPQEDFHVVANEQET